MPDFDRSASSHDCTPDRASPTRFTITGGEVAQAYEFFVGALERMLRPGAGVSVLLLIATPAEDADVLAGAALDGWRRALEPHKTVATSSESASTAGAPERRPDESAVSYVQRVRREHGDIALKPREWAPRLGLSASEIERAIAHGAAASIRKSDGRDHGARLVSAESMFAYLTLVDAVGRRIVTPPTWWAAVRRGRWRSDPRKPTAASCRVE